ncbi:MAG: DsbA family protein [Hydrogenovibrio crunogenus]|uniref:Dithiol-disulfide isomerase n=2 Tax=Hydrogenovibrio TaxID=28884 RepID=A0A410H5Q0_9GAMM|nr:DsbA family protein [Hydrogenovibrio thermophilus]MBD3612184.1 DsbA family protein [Hydrogenovibrio crunogenus]QAB16248.1 dithiol-disulfide isomerase [Hydrogenovibrio thermophilus]
MTRKIKITFLGDILCVWAYSTHALLEKLKHEYADRIEIDYRFISVFGDAEKFIEDGWHDKGSYSGFSNHLQAVANELGYINVNPVIWKDCKPKTSSMAHLYMKAIQLWEQKNMSLSDNQNPLKRKSEEVLWQMRVLFFEQGKDISNTKILDDLLKNANIDPVQITPFLEDGSAMASLLSDYELEPQLKLDGSPTLLLNENRQKLYGNIGYEVIKANIEALL